MPPSLSIAQVKIKFKQTFEFGMKRHEISKLKWSEMGLFGRIMSDIG